MTLTVDSSVDCSMGMDGVAPSDFTAGQEASFSAEWAKELGVDKNKVKVKSVSSRSRRSSRSSSRRRGLLAAVSGGGINVAFAVTGLGEDPAAAAAVSSGISAALSSGDAGGAGGALQAGLAASFVAAGVAAPAFAIADAPKVRDRKPHSHQQTAQCRAMTCHA